MNVNKFYIFFNELYSKYLLELVKKKRMSVGLVFLFGCIYGFYKKVRGVIMKDKEIERKLLLLDNKKEELKELQKNLESVKELLYKLQNELEKDKSK
jgi:hypothetical protein